MEPEAVEPPETKFTRTSDGFQIAYQVLGKGPDLLFQLGWPTQLLMLWEHPAVARFFTRLASFSRLILFDERGTGLSDRGQIAKSFEESAEDIELLGNDIGGIAVHIGQRVSALAAPNEVLVSSTVKDLVSGSGIGFADRGVHALKGIPEEWRLFAVEP